MEQNRGNGNSERNSTAGTNKNKIAQRLYVDIARKFRSVRQDNGWTITRSNGVVQAEHLSGVEKGIPQEVILVQFTNPKDSGHFKQIKISVTKFNCDTPNSRTELDMRQIADEEPTFSHVTREPDSRPGMEIRHELKQTKAVKEFVKTISSLP